MDRKTEFDRPYYGYDSKRISAEYRFARWKRGMYRGVLKEQRRLYEKRIANIPKRKEAFGEPRFETFEELVSAYIAGYVKDDEYYKEYNVWSMVYDDRGYEKKIAWLERELARAEIKLRYWQREKEQDVKLRKREGYYAKGGKNMNKVRHRRRQALRSYYRNRKTIPKSRPAKRRKPREKTLQQRSTDSDNERQGICEP